MKKILVLILLSMTLVSSSDLMAEEPQDLIGGVSFGLNRGLNEPIVEDRGFDPMFGALIMWRNAFGQGLSPEFSFTVNNNKSTDLEVYSGYDVSHLSFDLRLRAYPFDLNHWAPYGFAGLGYMTFKNEGFAINPGPNPEAELEGGSLYFPLGVGISHFFSPMFGMDLSFGYNVSLTDDLNPVWDDVNDGIMMAKLSVLIKLHEFIKDSDGDGLSDEEEVRLGTDPNNPDTDGDGLLDGEEVNQYKTDPLDPDTDDGGINDGIEVNNGADPLDADDDILSIGVGNKLILRNIEFDTGKSTIRKSSERILGFAFRALSKATDMEIEIVGHTDDVGEDTSNLTLSQDRANSVMKWFVDKGIDPSRLSASGKGETEPLVPNTTDANRQKNRRVEFIRSK